MKAVTHKQVLRKLFKKSRFRQGFEEELEKLRLVDALIALREKQGLTQEALARRLGVSQPFIAKLERAETHNFTLDTLIRIVRSLNGELTIHIKANK